MKLKFNKQNLPAIGILLALMFVHFGVKAQKTRELTQDDDNKKTSQKRIALVIGNGAYTKAKALPNPPNDAADMAQTLTDLGFEVISGTNQTKRQTETLIREFGTKLAGSGGIGLFYYAGHGIQVGGENYLVPVDADIPEEDEVAYSAVPISLVLSKMMTAKNDLNIIILDACRNNPFARSWRSFRDSSNSDGLAKISPPTGTLVLYATEPGKVASDGAGRNGLFTEALLKQIKRPNLEYDQMVKALSADVWQKSNKQQLPWKEGNTLQDFYFVKAEQKTTTVINPLPINKTNKSEPTNEKKSEVPIVPENGNSEQIKKQISEPLKTETVPQNLYKIELVWIPPGEFMMGSSDAEIDQALKECKIFWKECKRDGFNRETPKHKVTIKEGFWMGKYEITQGQWQAIMGNNPSSNKTCGANCPVENISWNEIQDFLKKLNAKNDGYEYSLPSESQWEYAARAGTTTLFAFGNSLNSSQANIQFDYPRTSTDDKPLGQTKAVGSYKPNTFGLYD
ncbi:MAG TPA: caspase family protein, partial [Pyrinomonadaceae bacterium]|nr:caspase family protein [Pyrinomonadaceae bacterium]